MKLKLAEFETEQQRLALLEEFEKADSMNDTIEMSRARLSSTVERVARIQSDISNCLSELNENRQLQVSYEYDENQFS